jgi:hypothetical protein
MKLIGNPKKATLLIFLFIGILCALAWRCSSAAEMDLRGGASFGPSGSAPVLGMDLYFSQPRNVDIYAGTTLWGQTIKADTNWDWHAGFRTCRGPFCASLGAVYLQRIDAVDGSHTNFNLQLSYRWEWWRFRSLSISHLSNAGTTDSNLGRNAALVDFQLQ